MVTVNNINSVIDLMNHYLYPYGNGSYVSTMKVLYQPRIIINKVKAPSTFRLWGLTETSNDFAYPNIVSEIDLVV